MGTFAELLRGLTDARRLENNSQIASATGVGQAQFKRYFDEGHLPEWPSAYKIARGLKLGPAESRDLFAAILRDKMMDEVGQAGIFLFLAVQDRETRRLTIEALREMLDLTFSEPFLDAGMEKIGRAEDDEMLAYREAMTPWFIRSVMLSTDPPDLRIQAGSVLSALLGRIDPDEPATSGARAENGSSSGSPTDASGSASYT